MHERMERRCREEEKDLSEYILELKGITKIFPGVKALDHVSFQLKPGEIHALMGENGGIIPLEMP